MNRTELTLIIASALVLALLTGWVLRWMFSLMNRPKDMPVMDESEMAVSLREAQEAQAVAEGRLSEVEGSLQNQLTQTRAELSAAMEGLGDARREAEELRTELEKAG